MAPPVKQAAIARGLAVYQPKKSEDPEFIQILRKLEPQIIVVVAFGQIIPQEILELAPFGCINVHGSLLPNTEVRLLSNGLSSTERKSPG